MAKHKEHIDEKKIKLISFISFLLGFSQAILLYVMSEYFKESLGHENVGIFYTIAYTVSLVLLLNMHKLIKQFGKATAFSFLFFLQIVIVALMTLVNPSLLGIVLLMGYIVIADVLWAILDIILESFSEDKKSGRIRGLHLVILGMGYLLGPLFSTRIFESKGFYGLFFIVMLMNMFIFLVALVSFRNYNQRFHEKLTIKDVVHKVLINGDLLKIYSISFALEFFYALMVIFTPLYLLNLGLGWDKIGIIFTVMLIPFTFMGYPAGRLADTKWGEKEMIIVALIVMSISTATIYFISSTSVVVWAAVLFVTRLGASLVEILRDSYFYKCIDGRDMDLISFFRTARSVANIIATAISVVLLVFFPMKAVFLLVAFFMVLALIPAFKLVDSKCEAELKLAEQKVIAD